VHTGAHLALHDGQLLQLKCRVAWRVPEAVLRICPWEHFVSRLLHVEGRGRTCRPAGASFRRSGRHHPQGGRKRDIFQLQPAGGDERSDRRGAACHRRIGQFVRPWRLCQCLPARRWVEQGRRSSEDAAVSVPSISKRSARAVSPSRPANEPCGPPQKSEPMTFDNIHVAV
jgi:hypothetical protein